MDPSSPPRRLRFQFSLLTLMSAVLLLGSAATLWTNWAPWRADGELKGHTAELTHAAFSHDGQRIATSSRDGSVRVWRAGDGALITALSPSRPPRWMHSQFSPDDTLIASVGLLNDRSVVCLWTVENGVGARNSWLPVETGAISARFSPDGQRLITAGESVALWDVAKGTALPAWAFHWTWSMDVNYSPDGERLVSAGLDGAWVLDVRTGTRLLQLGDAERQAFRSSFSPDGSRVLTSTRDAKVPNCAYIQTWDARSGEALLDVAFPEKSGRGFAEFSPDGKYIVTVDGSGWWRIWNAQSGAHLHARRISERALNHACYSPDGKRIVVCGRESTAYVFRRVHPEDWWGVTHHPVFWTTVLFASTLLYSLFRDWRRVSKLR